jgi:hypothetical protein
MGTGCASVDGVVVLGPRQQQWERRQGTKETSKMGRTAGRRWLTPVILATQEAEIRRIEFRSQPGQIVHETLSRKKKKNHKKLVW